MQGQVAQGENDLVARFRAWHEDALANDGQARAACVPRFDVSLGSHVPCISLFARRSPTLPDGTTGRWIATARRSTMQTLGPTGSRSPTYRTVPQTYTPRWAPDPGRHAGGASLRALDRANLGLASLLGRCRAFGTLGTRQLFAALSLCRGLKHGGARYGVRALEAKVKRKTRGKPMVCLCSESVVTGEVRKHRRPRGARR